MDLSVAEWSSRIRLYPISTRTSRRQPRRNIRDPRLPSYKKPTSPTPPASSSPHIIPLDYSPVTEAKAPKRTKRPFQARATLLNLIIKNLYKSTIKPTLNLPYSKPTITIPTIYLRPQHNDQIGMTKLMADMTAIHAPTLPPKKIVGELVKNGRKPKAVSYTHLTLPTTPYV